MRYGVAIPQANQFATPEDINDSPHTAPSKRVEALFPGYEKPLLGNLAALEIGLEAIVRECTNFRRWLDNLVVALDAIHGRGLHQARIYTCKECGGLHVGVEPEDEGTVN